MTSEASWELGQGDHLQIRPPGTGWRAWKTLASHSPWPRQNPVERTPSNLSGSGSETHQHFSTADANCCQSLLLDPDATIGIDLHKRLFLLVTGRGE
jgi:hypothetical protein